jgi:hypothetical protein
VAEKVAQPAQPPVASAEPGRQRREVLPVRLPRLQPPPRPDEQRAPEVTVNIGRIEVVPPAVPDRPPVREKPRTRAESSGAPALADYLRERSRR